MINQVEWDDLQLGAWKKFTGPFSIQTHRLSSKFLTNIAKIESMGGYIAGGFARAMASLQPNKKDPANQYTDIDIFMLLEDKYNDIFTLLSNEYDYMGMTNYNNFEVDNFLYVDKNIQLVKNSFLAPRAQIKRFDISVCKAYILAEKVYVDPQCLEDSISGIMHYNRMDSIQMTPMVIYRLIKYFEKGFKIELNNIMKIYNKIEDSQQRKHFVYCLKDYRNNIIDYDKMETIDKFYSL